MKATRMMLAVGFISVLAHCLVRAQSVESVFVNETFDTATLGAYETTNAEIGTGAMKVAVALHTGDGWSSNSVVTVVEDAGGNRTAEFSHPWRSDWGIPAIYRDVSRDGFDFDGGSGALNHMKFACDAALLAEKRRFGFCVIPWNQTSNADSDTLFMVFVQNGHVFYRARLSESESGSGSNYDTGLAVELGRMYRYEVSLQFSSTSETCGRMWTFKVYDPADLSEPLYKSPQLYSAGSASRAPARLLLMGTVEGNFEAGRYAAFDNVLLSGWNAPIDAEGEVVKTDGDPIPSRVSPFRIENPVKVLADESFDSYIPRRFIDPANLQSPGDVALGTLLRATSNVAQDGDGNWKTNSFIIVDTGTVSSNRLEFTHEVKSSGNCAPCFYRYIDDVGLTTSDIGPNGLELEFRFTKLQNAGQVWCYFPSYHQYWGGDNQFELYFTGNEMSFSCRDASTGETRSIKASDAGFRPELGVEYLVRVVFDYRETPSGYARMALWVYDTTDFSAPVWSTGRVLTCQPIADRMPHTFVIHCGADPNMAVDGPFFAVDDVYLALVHKGDGLSLILR